MNKYYKESNNADVCNRKQLSETSNCPDLRLKKDGKENHVSQRATCTPHTKRSTSSFDRSNIFFTIFIMMLLSCIDIYYQHYRAINRTSTIAIMNERQKSHMMIYQTLIFPFSSIFVQSFVLKQPTCSPSSYNAKSNALLYSQMSNCHRRHQCNTSLLIASTFNNEEEASRINHSSSEISSLERNHTPPNSNSKQDNAIKLTEVDVRHDTRTLLKYDPTIERYIEYHDVDDNYESKSTGRSNGNTLAKINTKIVKIFANNFLPEGVNRFYYTYVKWRILQRFINANVHVFGTQSLLMGLGKQNNRLSAGATLGLSAVLNWVLKDALGKIVRMLWASKMGRKFDSDAKRWRYRSSLLFALGNGLEVMTYVYPTLFLLLATMANACKQMGMLTSSATRNAIYNSFRDGSRENIGDITAKGEAQIAIVDLLGIMSGVCLSSKYFVTTWLGV